LVAKRRRVGVLAHTPQGFEYLRDALPAALVEKFFKRLGCGKVVRYDLPNLHAFNYVLPGVLAGGASRSLRIDAQGKALGQALLELVLDISETELARYKPRRKNK
jgi:hypothetical protein